MLIRTQLSKLIMTRSVVLYAFSLMMVVGKTN